MRGDAGSTARIALGKNCATLVAQGFGLSSTARNECMLQDLNYSPYASLVRILSDVTYAIGMRCIYRSNCLEELEKMLPLATTLCMPQNDSNPRQTPTASAKVQNSRSYLLSHPIQPFHTLYLPPSTHPRLFPSCPISPASADHSLTTKAIPKRTHKHKGRSHALEAFA